MESDRREPSRETVPSRSRARRRGSRRPPQERDVSPPPEEVEGASALPQPGPPVVPVPSAGVRAPPVSSTPSKQPRLDTSTDIRLELANLSSIDFEYSGSEEEEEEESDSDLEYQPTETDRQIDVDDLLSDEEDEDDPAPRTPPPPALRPGRRDRRPRAARPRRGRARSPSEDLYQWDDCAQFTPDVPQFDRTSAGITPEFDVPDDAPESTYFKKFMDVSVMTFVTDQTNLYHRFVFENDPAPVPTSSKMKSWVDVTVEEMYLFLGIMMLMAHTKKHVVKHYWTTYKFHETPIFCKYMTRDRFAAILQYLHFADNEQPNRDDQLWKVREVFTMIRERFAKFFNPFQKLVIDELLVLFHGRVIFRQYIPSKRHRYGIKFFVLCDCETGYVLDMVTYTASDVDFPAADPLGFSGSVVKHLLAPYLAGNHILFTDNYYTSPKLATYLLQHGIGCCGTVRKNRKYFPKFPKGAPGEISMKKCDKLLGFQWMDKDGVRMLSTVHTGRMMDTKRNHWKTGDRIFKPDAIMDYNINMRLVDKTDMQVATIECVRKTIKWYKKFFLHLLDIVMLNAYNLWLVNTGKRVSFREFHKVVIEQLLEEYVGPVAPITLRRVTGASPDRLAGRDYIARHHLEILPPAPGKTRGQRACHVCRHTTKAAGKRKDVSTYCKACNVALCIPCFTVFHTEKNF